MRLDWAAHDGTYAHGRENIYLIHQGATPAVRLTWWRRPATALPHETLLVARQALAHAVNVTTAEGARELAQRWEDGSVDSWAGEPR
jgi:hypothetical protein